MPSSSHTPSTSSSTAPWFREPNHFVPTRQSYWRCSICPDTNDAEYNAKQAIAHEDCDSHRAQYQILLDSWGYIPDAIPWDSPEATFESRIKLLTQYEQSKIDPWGPDPAYTRVDEWRKGVISELPPANVKAKKKASSKASSKASPKVTNYSSPPTSDQMDPEWVDNIVSRMSESQRQKLQLFSQLPIEKKVIKIQNVISVMRPAEALMSTNEDIPASLISSSTPIHENSDAVPKTTFEIEEPSLPSHLIPSRPYLPRVLPRIYGIASHVVNYIRGPRPPISLPGPTPWLNIKYHTLNLPLESSLIRFTRPISSPWFFTLFSVFYIISLAFFVRTQAFLTPADSFLTCLQTFWKPLNECGIDGKLCTPFNDTIVEVRCPAACSSVVLANKRTVGNDEVIYVPLIVGGGDINKTYRGDSFVCAAAVHAGLISDSKGGCASISLVGSFSNFLSSSGNGLISAAFPSIFPLSFRISPTTALSHCSDLRDEALAFNVLVTAIMFLVLRPKPIVLFWSLVCIGFWHVTFFSDPRDSPPPISDGMQTFLPVLFIAYAFWRSAWRYNLPFFSNLPIERMVWYLAPFWAGCNFNVVTGKIPIDRLLATDIASRPGAVVALIVIAIVVFALVLNQARVIRNTGWVPYYCLYYVIGALALLVISQLPGLVFRFHHYFAAIVITPLTAFPTRLSAVYQAFCLGMFLQGAAKFDLDSIFQTVDDLRRDAPLGSSLPIFLTNSTNYNSSIPLINQTLTWNNFLNTTEGWNGFSLLVDDVERFAGLAFNFSLKGLELGIPHFFRLAFQKDGTSGDYTMPAILWPNGTFQDPLPGPS